MKVSKKFKFEAAHRLMTSYTKACQNIHGHSYVVEISIDTYKELNKDGMVMDFKELKDIVNPLFDLLDHSIIFYEEDLDYIQMFKNRGSKITHLTNDVWPSHGKAEVVLMDRNPTAENMCITFSELIGFQLFLVHPELLYSGLTVKVFETASSEAKLHTTINGERKVTQNG